MHRGSGTWCACLAGAFVAILSTGANAQLVQPSGGGGQLAAEPPIARLSQADRRLDAQPVGGQQTAADLAARVAERLAADPRLSSVEVAGPGFINLKVSEDERWALKE